MESTKTRFGALDGLRALSIILVFLNHISTNFILLSIPPFFKPLAETLTSSGRSAVSIFFLLSGFLMAYFYPVVENKTKFLQKRYTRIFPLFLTMVAVRMLFRNYPDLNWFTDIGILFALPIITHIIWVYGIQKINNSKLSKILFYGFIVLQILVGVYYVGFIMRKPAIVFNQQTSPVIRESSIGLVNATLTLPLGDYIPMLDGVYWSLVAEVLFYVIFPFTFAPIANYIQSKSRLTISIFFAAIVPFFIGLDLLSKKVMVLSLLDLPFFYYFVVGITIAYIMRNEKPWLHKFENFVNQKLVGYVLPIFLVVVLFFLHVLFKKQSSEWLAFTRIIFSIPLGFIFLAALMHKSFFSKLLQSKWLVFLGTISYSMYLAHTSVVDIAKKIYTPHSLVGNSIFVLATFAVLCFVSYILFYFLEKPYFSGKKSEAKNMKNVETKKILRISVQPIFWSIIFVYGILILFAFQSNFNFFSIDHKYSVNDIVYPTGLNSSVISMREHPQIKYRFTSEENNMGILTMDLQYRYDQNKTHQNIKGVNQDMIFKIREVGQTNWLSETTYKPVQIGSKNQPFGFPLIADSKGKQYEVELDLTHPNLPEYIEINTGNSLFKSVHQLNKSEVIKSPLALYKLILNRVNNIITNEEAHYAFNLLVPFIILVIFFNTQERYKKLEK